MSDLEKEIVDNDVNADLKTEYRKALISATGKIFKKYKNFNNKYPNEEHVTSPLIAQVVAASAAIGTTVGTVVPGPGNAVGAGVGVLVGLIAATVLELSNKPKNLKINNAKKVVDFLGDDEEKRDEILKKTAKAMIAQQDELISSLKNTSENKKSLTALLAVNLFSAIKDASKSDDGNFKNKVKAIMDSSETVRSKKIKSCELETTSNEKIKFKL